jgi:CheY-like chemotaxis protein
MKILMLDDEEIRQRTLRRMVRDKAIVVGALNPTVFFEVLSISIPDLILLDHDLGSRSNNGEDVCHKLGAFVQKLDGKWFPPVIIHSSNRDGALAMHQTLNLYDIGNVIAEFGSEGFNKLIKELKDV